MWIERLRIEGFRCIAAAELNPCAGLNLVLGDNGAGKTSVLEAINLLASGRSFRTSKPQDMLRSDADLVLAADIRSEHGCYRVGLARESLRWMPRLDGQAVRGFAEIAERLAVEVFEPNSHEIVSGGSEHRRRFLDWGVFHVERAFGSCWSRYQRALKQRNALLRGGTATRPLLEPWTRELVQHGEEINRCRLQFLDRYRPLFANNISDLAPELGAPDFRFKPGWTGEDLAKSMDQSLDRDLLLGHTTRGPHRADWQLRFESLGSRERWSRGQQKIAVFGLCRAMLDVYARQRGEPAVACLDDVFSELDQTHQKLCLRSLEQTGAQVWLTATESMPALYSWRGEMQQFHVEHGRITVQSRHRL